jgi:hypothetical protein
MSCYAAVERGEAECAEREQCVWGCALWNHWESRRPAPPIRSRDFVPEPYPRSAPISDYPEGWFRPENAVPGQQFPVEYDDCVQECPCCGCVTDLGVCPGCGEPTVTLPGATWDPE